MTRDVMDAKQVAKYLGIATTTVYKWVELRKIPYTKVGHLLRFPKWLIDQWLTEKAQRAESEDLLFERFVKMQQRYHLEMFLKSRGLDAPDLEREHVLAELKRAVDELEKDEEQG